MKANVQFPPDGLQIEAWQVVALAGVGGTAQCQLALIDSNSRTVPFTQAGVESGSITLQIGQGGGSLPYLAAQAGFNVATNGIPGPSTDGVVQAGVGGAILNTGSVPISFNTAGTIDGSGSSGIAGSVGRGPSQSGPWLLQPGERLILGRFLE